MCLTVLGVGAVSVCESAVMGAGIQTLVLMIE